MAVPTSGLAQQYLGREHLSLHNSKCATDAWKIRICVPVAPPTANSVGTTAPAWQPAACRISVHVSRWAHVNAMAMPVAILLPGPIGAGGLASAPGISPGPAAFNGSPPRILPQLRGTPAVGTAAADLARVACGGVHMDSDRDPRGAAVEVSANNPPVRTEAPRCMARVWYIAHT